MQIILGLFQIIFGIISDHILVIADYIQIPFRLIQITLRLFQIMLVSFQIAFWAVVFFYITNSFHQLHHNVSLSFFCCINNPFVVLVLNNSLTKTNWCIAYGFLLAYHLASAVSA